VEPSSLLAALAACPPSLSLPLSLSLSNPPLDYPTIYIFTKDSTEMQREEGFQKEKVLQCIDSLKQAVYPVDLFQSTPAPGKVFQNYINY
jgi:hypothetical protein